VASTAPPTFVLIASPLVGPAGWRWLASELSSRGSPVVVPELAPTDAPAPVWPAHVARILEQVPAGAVVLVGHSAAGRLVPLVAAGRADPSICVFVDAQLPVDLLAPDADEWFHAHVRSIAVGDVLPPWSEWWGPEAWDALVPDPDRRAELAGALPRLTVAAATEVPPAPDRPVGRAAYLRLSPVFDRQADVARALGWPVRDLDGGHLHPAA
jgi:hypothetical protein